MTVRFALNRGPPPPPPPVSVRRTQRGRRANTWRHAEPPSQRETPNVFQDGGHLALFFHSCVSFTRVHSSSRCAVCLTRSRYRRHFNLAPRQAVNVPPSVPSKLQPPAGRLCWTSSDERGRSFGSCAGVRFDTFLSSGDKHQRTRRPRRPLNRRLMWF